MPADIALPISVSTNTPDIDLGAGRNSIVNQSVDDKRQAFNQEYQRQVDTRNEYRSRQKIQESRQQDARQADIRADERASQRADEARKTEQNRRDERVSQAERRNQQQESGKRLPENGNDRAKQTEQANADKTRMDSSRREAAQVQIRQAQQTESKQLDTQQQTQKAQELRHQNTQHSQAKNQSLENDMADDALARSADEVVLSPYILQQLSDTGANSIGEGADTSGLGAESDNSMSSLVQWMEQTLGADQGAADNDSIGANAGGGSASTSEPAITSGLESVVSSASSKDTLSLSSGKVNDSATTSGISVKPEGQTDGAKVAESNAAKNESAEALRNMEDVARLLDAKRSAENSLETALPGSKIQPLSQAIESVNRSDRLAEPTFLKQTALSSEGSSNGLSLDELKQMMQERKSLLEGGRLEGGAAALKAGAEDVMTPQTDKLLALDKRLSQGMEGLRQLRIPGQEAKKAVVDDGVKSSSFGRALEQMSSIKTEEVKPLSTSIATPMNKPGFTPEFNQRIMMMIGQRIQAAEIKLNPEELGSIDVSIKFNQDQQASIVFVSPHSVTRDALEQGAQRLRDMLEQNGVDVDSVDIQENLTHDRHNQDNEGKRGLAGSSTDKEGASDETEEMDDRVATIETDSLVDFYA
ncbi:hypothetical protein A9Q81_07350 [Gammaproteobacteria bacterium 42_54_T18]|nr:hypothetical protein A9Q81_07350 [Gammaproteobacteria bacterium 42_54_T18]